MSLKPLENFHLPLSLGQPLGVVVSVGKAYAAFPSFSRWVSFRPVRFEGVCLSPFCSFHSQNNILSKEKIKVSEGSERTAKHPALPKSDSSHIWCAQPLRTSSQDELVENSSYLLFFASLAGEMWGLQQILLGPIEALHSVICLGSWESCKALLSQNVARPNSLPCRDSFFLFFQVQNKSGKKAPGCSFILSLCWFIFSCPPLSEGGPWGVYDNTLTYKNSVYKKV